MAAFDRILMTAPQRIALRDFQSASFEGLLMHSWQTLGDGSARISRHEERPFFPAPIGDNWGIIANRGNVVHPIALESVPPFSEGLAAAKV